MKKLLGIVGAVVATLLGLLVLLVVVAVVLLNSGALNGLIEDRIAAAAAGHPANLEQAPSLGFEDGALTLDVGPLSIANAEWAADQHSEFARIQELHASLRLLPLLRGRIELPEITIEAPQLHLARSEDGRTNWPEGEEEGGPVWIPEIANLVIRNAEVTYADAAAAIDAEVVLDEASGRLGGGQDLALQATGRLEDAPLQVNATGGSIMELFNEKAMSKPAKFEATIGGSRIDAEAKSFADLEALDAKVEIDAERALAALLADMGIAKVDLPPFQATATVEPGTDGSKGTADLEIEGASLQVDGKVADLADPEQAFTVDLVLDAPELGTILADFDVPYADQVPSAKIEGDVAHGSDGTTFALQGSVGGDAIALEGGYVGGLTAFSKPHANFQLKGGALGALPAQLGFARRPIESYRIEADVEERTGEASPVKLDVTIEETRVRFEGSLDDLRAAKGIDGRVQVQGPNPADVLDLFKLPAISLPPYDFAGQIIWRGDDIKVADLNGKFGDSDARGTIAFDLRSTPPAVTGGLQSDRVVVEDLTGLIGAPVDPEAKEAELEQGKLLPTGAIDPEAWRDFNLDVRYKAKRIESAFLPIDRIEAHLVSKDGWLTLDPLLTGLADGAVTGFASLDGTRTPVAGKFDIRLSGLQVQDMLTKLGVDGEAFGEVNGRVRFEGRGGSVDKLLGSADGQVVLSMTGGALDSLIVEAIGLDVAESIAVLLDSVVQTEEDKTPIRCAIVNLQLEQGVAIARPIVIDTTDSKITVDGRINLADETLDVFIEALPKDPSLFSGNQPIHVDGPLLSPSVNPAPGRTESEPLGWLLAPLAAVLPFFDVGDEEDSPCGSLIADAKEAGTAPPD